MKTKICLTCKKHFEVCNFRKDIAKFCSYKCYWNTSIKKCQMCGKSFKTKLSHLKKGWGKYCSCKCYGKSKEGTIGYWSNRKRLKMRGKNNPGWKGGKSKEGVGYILIRSLNHPLVKINGYVQEHRLVVEKWLRKNKPNHPALIEIKGIKYLNPKWVVHHLNGIKDDNRIENLKPFNNSKHSYFHSLYIKTLQNRIKELENMLNCKI